MTSQKGVLSCKLSGLRATIMMKEGVALSEEKLKAALKGGVASFVSLEKKEIPVHKSSYMLAVTGAT